MERLTIDGGEVWLGFARNRVKAFKRAGIRYTRQVFEMPDGAKVIVELAGKDHTIRLVGSSIGSIISGVVKGGRLVDLPVPQGSPPNTKPKKILRSFKATVDAAKKVLKKPKMAEAFGDIKELAIPLANNRYFYNPKASSSQSSVVVPSMYSGKMKQVVQILLGSGAQITYLYGFHHTHGIHKAADGSFWVILISRQHGVLATPMQFHKIKKTKSSPKVVEKSFELFGGVPTGNDFPPDIEGGIKSGEIIRLATADEISAFYKLDWYCIYMGWSFNLDGTEAHNTGHELAPYAGRLYSHSVHYKLNISIKKNAEGVFVGKATLTQVSKGVLFASGFKTSEGVPWGVIDAPFSMSVVLSTSGTYSKLATLRQIVGDTLFVATHTDGPMPVVTVYVGHREDGQLFTVGYGSELFVPGSYMMLAAIDGKMIPLASPRKNKPRGDWKEFRISDSYGMPYEIVSITAKYYPGVEKIYTLSKNVTPVERPVNVQWRAFRIEEDQEEWRHNQGQFIGISNIQHIRDGFAYFDFKGLGEVLINKAGSYFTTGSGEWDIPDTQEAWREGVISGNPPPGPEGVYSWTVRQAVWGFQHPKAPPGNWNTDWRDEPAELVIISEPKNILDSFTAEMYNKLNEDKTVRRVGRPTKISAAYSCVSDALQSFADIDIEVGFDKARHVFFSGPYLAGEQANSLAQDERYNFIGYTD